MQNILAEIIHQNEICNMVYHHVFQNHLDPIYDHKLDVNKRNIVDAILYPEQIQASKRNDDDDDD